MIVDDHKNLVIFFLEVDISFIQFRSSRSGSFSLRTPFHIRCGSSKGGCFANSLAEVHGEDEGPCVKTGPLRFLSVS